MLRGIGPANDGVAFTTLEDGATWMLTPDDVALTTQGQGQSGRSARGREWPWWSWQWWHLKPLPHYLLLMWQARALRYYLRW